MAIPQYHSYTPRESQVPFHSSCAGIKFACGGVGAGKTIMGAIEAIQAALENPGCVGMIVAPTWPLLERVTLRTFRLACPSWLIASEKKKERYIELINGFRFYYDSTKDPTRLEGSNLTVIWHDEARYSSRESFEILLGRLRAPESQRMQYILTSTPEYGWLYDEFALRCPSSSILTPSVYSQGAGLTRQWWVIPTDDNHYLPDSFVATLRDTYTSHTYKMYVDGVFAPQEGAVFDQFRDSRHLEDLQVYSHLPVHVGHDPGIRKSGVVFFQHLKKCPQHQSEDCIHVIGEDTPERQSTRETSAKTSALFSARGWLRGNVYMDKAGIAESSSVGWSDLDEWKAAGWKIKYTTQPDAVRVEYGEHIINGKLRSKSGRSSLYFDKSLDKRHDKKDRGIVKAIASSVYPDDPSSPGAQRAIKDGILDHIRDALRYPIINLFPPIKRKIRVL